MNFHQILIWRIEEDINKLTEKFMEDPTNEELELKIREKNLQLAKMIEKLAKTGKWCFDDMSYIKSQLEYAIEMSEELYEDAKEIEEDSDNCQRILSPFREVIDAKKELLKTLSSKDNIEIAKANLLVAEKENIFSQVLFERRKEIREQMDL